MQSVPSLASRQTLRSRSTQILAAPVPSSFTSTPAFLPNVIIALLLSTTYFSLSILNLASSVCLGIRLKLVELFTCLLASMLSISNSVSPMRKVLPTRFVCTYLVQMKVPNLLPTSLRQNSLIPSGVYSCITSAWERDTDSSVRLTSLLAALPILTLLSMYCWWDPVLTRSTRSNLMNFWAMVLYWLSANLMLGLVSCNTSFTASPYLQNFNIGACYNFEKGAAGLMLEGNYSALLIFLNSGRNNSQSKTLLVKQLQILGSLLLRATWLFFPLFLSMSMLGLLSSNLRFAHLEGSMLQLSYILIYFYLLVYFRIILLASCIFLWTFQVFSISNQRSKLLCPELYSSTEDFFSLLTTCWCYLTSQILTTSPPSELRSEFESSSEDPFSDQLLSES